MGKKFVDGSSPAYPSNGVNGMDLRTAIAMDMAKGILAGRNTGILSQNEINEITEKAVLMADKLIEQLNRL